MAEVNHWYRAHHGTVADPKFALVAVKAGQRRGDVIALWHYLLEEASAAPDRGNPGAPDFEVLDMMFEMPAGGASSIYAALVARGMIDAASGRIAHWEKRQPKRERDEEPGAAAERKRRQRSRERDADDAQKTTPDDGGTAGDTPRHVASRHVTPIGEEKREEYSVPKGTEADASPGQKPESQAEQTRQELWRAGKSLLAEQGLPKAQCGTFVGKLVKDYGDAIVIDAVRATVSQRPPDAASYLKATCMRMKGERVDQNASPPGYADMTAKLDAEATRERATPDQVQSVVERVKAAKRALAQAEVGHGTV